MLVMSSLQPFYANGLAFECTRCSACCRHDPGYVFLSQNDLDKLCAHSGMSESDFRKKYCRVVDFGIVKRLSLIEKKNFDCVFWEGDGCSVYAARPLQCRAFPFWMQNVESAENWQSVAQDCPGVNRGKVHDRAIIESWLNSRLNESPLED